MDKLKLKSSGFASYIPPGRRLATTESAAPEFFQKYEDRTETACAKGATLSVTGKFPHSEPETADLQAFNKLSKKLRREVPREYVPPSRRYCNPDLVAHDSMEIDNVVEEAPSSSDIPKLAGVDSTSAEVSQTDEAKLRKITRRGCSETPWENYVPPARRAMIAEETRQAAEDKALGIIRLPKIIAKKCDGFPLVPVVQPIIEDNIVYDEDSVRKCSFVVRGLPPEMPDHSKIIYMKPFTDRGAIVRWLSSMEAILVFPSEAMSKSINTIRRNTLLQIVCLQDLQESESDLYLTACTDIYNVLKPERDCRVANRMISAALGISLPKKPPTRAKSPKKMDAWDD